MSRPEEPPAHRRLAAAFGLPVVVDAVPDPAPGPSRLNAVTVGRLRPWLAAGLVLLVLALVAVVSAARSRPQPVESLVVSEVSSAPIASGTAPAGDGGVTVVVHVAGSVAAPGVVTLPAGARVAEAVAAAGGALPGASLDGVNLARRLTDGEQVVVGVAPPAPAPAAGGAAAGATPSATDALIDLNTATSEQLQELPRVGPATAEKIIAYREENGRFSSIDQLLEVPGIGERTLAGLRERVRV